MVGERGLKCRYRAEQGVDFGAEILEDLGMSNRHSPIYRALGHRYHIDTCQPQIEAQREGKITMVGFSHGLYPGKPLLQDQVPGLSAVGYVDAVGFQGWKMDLHRNEGIEVCFLETGTLSLTVEDRPVTMQANDMSITRPWQEHGSGEVGWNPGLLHWLVLDVGVRRPNQLFVWPDWVVLTTADKDELSDLLRRNEQPLWTANTEIARCFSRIARAVEIEPNRRTVSRLAVYINELLLTIIDVLALQSDVKCSVLSPNYRTVELFLHDLRRNPEHLEHPWMLDEMAAECDISKTSLVRYVRQITNESPIDFLNRCRIEAAANALVSDPGRAVTEVALQHGFGSSQYFANRFRLHYGCTPSEWRKRARSDSSATEAPEAT